jgi:hypothetical protein
MQTFRQFIEAALDNQLGPAIGPKPFEFVPGKNKKKKVWFAGRDDQRIPSNYQDPERPIDRSTHIEDDKIPPEPRPKKQKVPALGNMVYGNVTF